jgi:hypothetical protein
MHAGGLAPETREKGASKLGGQRGGSGRRETQRIGRERSWGPVIVAALVVAVLGAFVVAVVLDARQRVARTPPGEVQSFDVPSRGHIEGDVSYEQTPPVGGEHNPVWQNCGFYSEPIRSETAVHALEHGAVWITYRPDLPQQQVDEIRRLASDNTYVLASPYPDLPAPVVASAWGKQLTLEAADDPGLERFVGAFRQGSQTPEPGAACTGGLGDPA